MASSTGTNKSAATPAEPANSGDASLLDALKAQHREMAAQLDKGDVDADALARAWARHAVIEEQVLAPAIEAGATDKAAFAELAARRDLARTALRHLVADKGAGAQLLPIVKQVVSDLVAAEERPDTGLFALAGQGGVDLAALAGQANERGRQFDQNADVEFRKALEPNHFRSGGSGNAADEESTMPDNMRDRDENGRFRSSDDDRRGGYGGGGRDRDDRGRYMSDDGRRDSYGGNDRERDDRGRFTGDDDRGYRSHGRDDDYRGSTYRQRDDDGRYAASRSDYDERRDRGGDGRGWYGDRDGHSEASRRGWDSREGGSRYGSAYDDDRRSSSYGNDRDRDDRGRFTSDDNRDYRSSRYDDDRRSASSGDGRGWHGDSEGHSEASRRGWEGRDDRYSRSDYDDRRPSRSSRDDDDNRGRSSGHGGWFGDPRGHAEAARRGWEDRR